jgi:hypothetical protein
MNFQPQYSAQFSVHQSIFNCSGTACDTSWNEIVTSVKQNTTDPSNNGPVYQTSITTMNSSSWASGSAALYNASTSRSYHDASGLCLYGTACACTNSLAVLADNCEWQVRGLLGGCAPHTPRPLLGGMGGLLAPHFAKQN